MAKNLEIKVACEARPLAAFAERAAQLGATIDAAMTQTDTYFSVPDGRLKLRRIAQGGQATAELIGYRRPGTSGSRWSEYERVGLDHETADGLARALGMTLGVESEVRKTRTVARWSRTRIHLDEVAGLGRFVELETVAGPEDAEQDILREHETVIRALGLDRLPVVVGSYGELILACEESLDDRAHEKGRDS
jgi:predicted adenylyl cyclase CyaB